MFNRKFIIFSFSVFTLAFMPVDIKAAVTKSDDYQDLKSAQISSYSAAVVDSETGDLLFGKREDTEKPVASITKILGANVYLDSKPNLNKKVRMEGNDEVAGGRLKLPIGTTMRAINFLNSSLIGSANNSATALIRLSGLSKSKFVNKMNNLADSAGAQDANFVDSSGISPNNQASAKDLALIGRKVYSNSRICSISSKQKYSFDINNGKGTKSIAHTSSIFSKSGNDFKILAAKTGYLPEVGNNLIVKLQNKKNSQAKIIVVVMGAKTQSANALDVSKLAKWAFENYNWTK